MDTRHDVIQTCSELRIVNVHAKMVVFLLTASSPKTHVTPSKGRRMMAPLMAVLGRKQSQQLIYRRCSRSPTHWAHERMQSTYLASCRPLTPWSAPLYFCPFTMLTSVSTSITRLIWEEGQGTRKEIRTTETQAEYSNAMICVVRIRLCIGAKKTVLKMDYVQLRLSTTVTI